MDLIIPENREDELEADRARLKQRLTALYEGLEALETRVLSENLGKRSDATALLSDVRYWLRQVKETENTLAEVRKERAGVAGAVGCDLDVARVEIGCRLARIRRCCDAGRLPE